MKKFCCEKMKEAITTYGAISLEEEVRGYFLRLPQKE
jgi:hypothetical protein